MLSDVDADDKSIALAITGQNQGVAVSSSSSGLSIRSSLAESPTASQEQIKAGHEVRPIGPRLELPLSDSDMEAETECPKIENVLDAERLKKMLPKQRKRQEVINELLHTERTHVRNLKVLYKVFYDPLLVNQILPPDFIKLLFANIEEILDMHSKKNKDAFINKL